MILHTHPCQDCGEETECHGELEANVDGEPEIICIEFHLLSGDLNPAFVCGSCQIHREDQDVVDLRGTL